MKKENMWNLGKKKSKIGTFTMNPINYKKKKKKGDPVHETPANAGSEESDIMNPINYLTTEREREIMGRGLHHKLPRRKSKKKVLDFFIKKRTK